LSREEEKGKENMMDGENMVDADYGLM